MTTANYLFGVVSDDGAHYADLWSKGVRATTFEFQWKEYEPQEGVFNQAYIDHMKQMLADLNNRGWYIQMIPGFHYAPDWVYTNYPSVFFVNQYGELYSPDPVILGDFRVINAPFNPQARSLIAGYIGRIFQDFNQSNPAYHFDSVRIGGGVQGELRYPPSTWNGHTNAYWAFDTSAQNSAVSAIPTNIVGWRPGIDDNPGTTGRGQLVANPGFEQNHDDYGIVGWSPDDEVTAELTTANPHGDSRSLKLNITSPNRIHQYVRVIPGTQYNLAGWLRSGNSMGRARIFITQYNNSWQPVTNAPFLKLETLSTTWVNVSGSLTASPSTSIYKIELDGDQAGTYYFDDLQLKRDGETNQQNRDITVPLEFYDWYVRSLTNYQNWQINEIRKYYSGQVDLVYAGKGVRPYQIMDAITNDLHGDGWSEGITGLYAGADYSRHVNGLSSDPNMALYLTGIEVPDADLVNDSSPYPNDWSGAHWLAQLAHRRGIPIWGENTGYNTRSEMNLVLTRMRVNGFKGIMWAIESQLYTSPNPNNFATIDDYSAYIQVYSNLLTMYLPLTLSHP